MKNSVYFSLIVLLICGKVLLLPAQTIIPDAAFGNAGYNFADFTAQMDIVYSVALQADGKVLLAGITNDPNQSDMGVVRLNTDGTFDNSFDTDGKVITDFSNAGDAAYAIAVQTDGKIVVGGTANNGLLGGSFDFAVARYLSDGSLDNTFGGNGKVVFDFQNLNDEIRELLIQPDGKIIAVGSSISSNQAYAQMSIWRINPDGTTDFNFNNVGTVTRLPGSQERILGQTALLQPDGGILCIGRWQTNTVDVYNLFLVRLNPDGTPDVSFDGDGDAIFNLGYIDEEVYGSALQSDGKIVLAGRFNDGQIGDDAFVARMNANGSIDNSFGTNGFSITHLGGDFDLDNFRSVALTGSGKILAAGYTKPQSFNEKVMLAQFNTDGTVDNAFGSGGVSFHDYSGLISAAYDMAIQPDGKIVIGGSKSSGSIIDNSCDYLAGRFMDATTVGMHENPTMNAISVYPNPVLKDEALLINVQELSQGKQLEFSIFDLYGKLVNTVTVFNGIPGNSFNSLISGVYFLKGNSEDLQHPIIFVVE